MVWRFAVFMEKNASSQSEYLFPSILLNYKTPIGTEKPINGVDSDLVQPHSVTVPEAESRPLFAKMIRLSYSLRVSLISTGKTSKLWSPQIVLFTSKRSLASISISICIIPNYMTETSIPQRMLPKQNLVRLGGKLLELCCSRIRRHAAYA